MHRKRLSLLVSVLCLAWTAVASSCSLLPRDSIEENDASVVWRQFWRNELGNDDGIDVASSHRATIASTTTSTAKHPAVRSPELSSTHLRNALVDDNDAIRATLKAEPQPPVWPDVFHALLFQTRNGTSSLVDLYYDFLRGRNANLIRKQLAEEGETLYDIEYNNHTSFYFTRPSSSSSSSDDDDEKRNKKIGTCKSVAFPVGILPPNWLEGARYLGTSIENGFECHGAFCSEFSSSKRKPVDFFRSHELALLKTKKIIKTKKFNRLGKGPRPTCRSRLRALLRSHN